MQILFFFHYRTRIALLLVLLVIIPVRLPAGDDGAVLVGSVRYTFATLCGKNIDQLRKDFDDQINETPIADQKQFIAAHELAAKDDIAKLADERIHELIWSAATQSLIEYSADTLFLASITDRIQKEHGIQIADYFDIPELRRCIIRQRKISELIYSSRGMTANQAMKQFEVIQQLGSTLSEKQFHVYRSMLRVLPFMAAWRLGALKHFEASDTITKAYCAHYLVSNACIEGVYFDLAKVTFRAARSPIGIIDIRECRAPQLIIEKSLAALRGNLGAEKKSVENIAKFISSSGSSALLEFKIVPSTSVTMADEHIPEGAVLRTGENEYRLYTINGETGGDNYVNSRRKFIEQEAFVVAARRLGPPVVSLYNNVQCDQRKVRVSLTIPPKRLFFSDITIPEVASSEYSSRPFNELEAIGPFIDEMALRAVQVKLTGDNSGMRELQERIALQIEKLEDGLAKEKVRRLQSFFSKELTAQ